MNMNNLSTNFLNSGFRENDNLTARNPLNLNYHICFNTMYTLCHQSRFHFHIDDLFLITFLYKQVLD